MTTLSARQETRTELLSLYNDLSETRNERERLEAEEKSIRARISELVASCDDMRFTIPGVAIMRISAPSERVSYDRKAIDALALQLHNDGLHDYARVLSDAQRRTQVAGTLRIDPDKA